ncbi:hypothetical protein F3Y22_tig00112000pilonHSYRG00429 [Hibiscus syriacus]|uniref:RING-type E3 ubiquitin transferase n=1 Tax=Hibiscus syriacus TaxID=106335 RepID=A0A6A2XW70_HIBSY|nr:hypothetical protein F3Y22_tig00112000pilonHSYRG00429 [Hibiscus syriacus]
MDWVFHQRKLVQYLSPTEQPYYLPQSPQSLRSDTSGLNKRAPGFGQCDRPPRSVAATFHLHDAGVDQSVIDTLPVFHYKSIIGVQNPFDCAVCLCEFEPEDKLRLSILLPDFSSPSPLVYALESGIHSSRETEIVGESVVGRSSSVLRSNSSLGLSGDIESCEIQEKDEANQPEDPIEETIEEMTCLPLTPGHQPAMSECDCESRRGFNGFVTTATTSTDDNGKYIGKTNKESFSISKIWLRGKDRRSCSVGSSRRAFSFRYSHNDEEKQRCHSLDSQAKTRSFARRTLAWLAGRQNKVVHSSFTPEHVGL